MARYALGIEISNPSSGPRGEVLTDRGPVLAGPGVSLGVIEDGALRILATELLHDTGRHDDDLMPAIDRLCRSHRVTPSDVKQVALSIGPGGYTSLRIAVATAKMIAEATGAATIPVPSALVAAWRLKLETPALVCIASKGQTAWAVWLPEGGPTEWLAGAQSLGLIDAAEIAARRPRCVVGDRFLPAAFRDAAAPDRLPVIEPVFAAASVLEIAASLDAIDPLALAPLYPREAEAVTQWRKRNPQ